MRKQRKGFALIEVVLSVAILSMASMPLLSSIVSEHTFNSYTMDKMSVITLARSKMNELEGVVRVNFNTSAYQNGFYYGFPYALGSEKDIDSDPSHPWTAETVGTFSNDGFPTVRYQYSVITAADGGKVISLLVWRKPDNPGNLGAGPILKTTLVEEIYDLSS
jgi:prepilin-type N-terminal cleavage/methylation domain-containing protein